MNGTWANMNKQFSHWLLFRKFMKKYVYDINELSVSIALTTHQLWHDTQPVYNKIVRTNNDCEGWHRRINARMSDNVNFYLLVQSMEEEAVYVEAQVELVREMKLTRIQRRTYSQLQERLLTAWAEYERGNLTVDQLLRRVSLFARS